MSEAPGPMHYADITETVLDRKLWSTPGATPKATVSATLSLAIKNDGDKCPFEKIGRGLYVWKGKPGIITPVVGLAEEEEEEVQYEIVTSFGMFWRRNAIEWRTVSKILGMQRIDAMTVDFYKQIGLYLLYDGREVIYVGRATDRPLGRRLYEHTSDRLSSRWDRFSWFGLLPVSEGGELGSLPESYDGKAIIPAVEALLIEALEPRQNRKRGDDFDVEYIQKEDPEIQKKNARQIVNDLLAGH